MKTEQFDFYDPTVIRSYNLSEKIRYQLKMLDGLYNFTRKHSENVASITCRLCEYLHLNKQFTIYATTCAYIHDLGKIFIPPTVLQKPGKLTDEEYSIMKTHTVKGEEFCNSVPALEKYAEAVGSHHENGDGSGYPDGITDVPLEAELIKVADIYDALINKRQYKEKIELPVALDILKEALTKHFFF